jgi:hypothetical protein
MSEERGPALARQYTSFLVRCWKLSSDALRIEIEQVPTGDRTVVESFSRGAEWMLVRFNHPFRDPQDAAAESPCALPITPDNE